LQHLQDDSPPRRWILKSPDHVYGLDALFSVFPDAVIIQTHRNPLEVLKSSSQVTEMLRKVFAWPSGHVQIGAREARVLADSVERFIRFRDAHPELADRFIDVKYPDLVGDPLGTVRRIYQALEIPLTEVAAQRIHQLASGRTRYRRRRAHPTLRDLGLDVSAEARRFERYCDRFGIPGGQPG